MHHRLLLIVVLFPLAGAAVQSADPATPRPAPGISLEDLEAQIPMTPQGRFLMEVPQILNTSTDRGVQSLLRGREVETTGQLIPDPDGGSGAGIRIFRAELLCCSAHTRKCSVALAFEGDAPDATGSPWVTLAGVLEFHEEEGASVPTIRIREMRRTIMPAKALLR